MGVVAIIAFSLGKRFMRFECFQTFFGLLMTTVAELRLFGQEEFLVLGSVTHVAAQTFLPACHVMGDSNFHTFLAMTGKA